MAYETQVTIILDSGLFLTDEKANGFTSSQVGYFTPHVYVYRDGEKAEELDAAKMGTGCRRINVRKFDATGKEIAEVIKFSQSLLDHLLRLHKIYGHIVLVDDTKLDCLFDFNSGHFCSLNVKERKFKECDGKTHELTGVKKSVGLIAHDIAIHYKLNSGETLKLTDKDGGVIWSSFAKTPNSRIDIDVIADNSTAWMFYYEALKLRGQNYWLPNQDNPPPTWVHGGHGGSGG